MFYSHKLSSFISENKITDENIDVFTLECPFSQSVRTEELFEKISKLEERYLNNKRKACIFSIIEKEYSTIYCSRLSEEKLIKYFKLRYFW